VTPSQHAKGIERKDLLPWVRAPTYAYGIGARDGSLVVRSSLVERNTAFTSDPCAQIIAISTEATIEDVVVRGDAMDADSVDSVAASPFRPNRTRSSIASFVRRFVEHVRDSGIYVKRVSATLEAVVVRDTLPTAADTGAVGCEPPASCKESLHLRHPRLSSICATLARFAIPRLRDVALSPLPHCSTLRNPACPRFGNLEDRFKCPSRRAGGHVGNSQSEFPKRRW
jgi:hypothetical protein